MAFSVQNVLSREMCVVDPNSQDSMANVLRDAGVNTSALILREGMCLVHPPGNIRIACSCGYIFRPVGVRARRVYGCSCPTDHGSKPAASGKKLVRRIIDPDAVPYVMFCFHDEVFVPGVDGGAGRHCLHPSLMGDAAFCKLMVGAMSLVSQRVGGHGVGCDVSAVCDGQVMAGVLHEMWAMVAAALGKQYAVCSARDCLEFESIPEFLEAKKKVPGYFPVWFSRMLGGEPLAVAEGGVKLISGPRAVDVEPASCQHSMFVPDLSGYAVVVDSYLTVESLVNELPCLFVDVSKAGARVARSVVGFSSGTEDLDVMEGVCSGFVDSTEARVALCHSVGVVPAGRRALVLTTLPDCSGCFTTRYSGGMEHMVCGAVHARFKVLLFIHELLEASNASYVHMEIVKVLLMKEYERTGSMMCQSGKVSFACVCVVKGECDTCHFLDKSEF